MAVGPDAVRFRPEIEPVVRWIEETPRDKAMEVAIAQLKAGLRIATCSRACSWRASATSSRGRSGSSSTPSS